MSSGEPIRADRQSLRQSCVGPAAQPGFTYLTLLFFLALLGVGLAGMGETWSHDRQREKERELLWIGNQFRHAIAQYYERTPGTVKRYPEKLEDLLEDRRYLNTQRYLRRIYPDPMSGKPQWGLVPAPQGGMMGVYSLSEAKPIKTAAFGREERAFENSAHYSDWRFIYEPPAMPLSATSAARR